MGITGCPTPGHRPVRTRRRLPIDPTVDTARRLDLGRCLAVPHFWNLSLAVNLTAPYLLCKSVLPTMLAANWGRIINIASINGKIGGVHGGIERAASRQLH